MAPVLQGPSRACGRPTARGGAGEGRLETLSWRSGSCVCLHGVDPHGSNEPWNRVGEIAGENRVGFGPRGQWWHLWGRPLVEGIVSCNRRHLGQAAPREALNRGFPNRPMIASSGPSSLLWHHILELMVAGEEKWRCSVASTTAKTTGLSGVAQRSLSEGRVLMDIRRWRRCRASWWRRRRCGLAR